MRWLVFEVSARREGVGDLDEVLFPAAWREPTVVEAESWFEAVESLGDELDGYATAIPLVAVEGFAHVRKTWGVPAEAVKDAVAKATVDAERVTGMVDIVEAYDVQDRLRNLLSEATERRTVVEKVDRSVDDMLGLAEPLAVNHHPEGATRPGNDPKPFTLAPDEDRRDTL